LCPSSRPLRRDNQAMEADPAAWGELAAAIVVAAVSFAGLVFVAMSINLDQIISLGGIADLALQGVIVLSAVAISAMVLLVPGQSTALLGLELLILGAALLSATWFLSSRSYQATAPAFRTKRVQTALFTSVPGLLVAVGGLSLLLGFGGGLYWLVPGWIAGVLVGIVNAWVLLVEVKR